MVEIVRPERVSQDVSLRFEVQPAYDLVISLAAAADPERYDLPQSFGREVRSALPASVRRDLRTFFGDPAPLGNNPVGLIPLLPSADPESFIQALEDLDPAEFAVRLIAHATAERPLLNALRRAARGRASEDDNRIIAQDRAARKADTRKRMLQILAAPIEMQARYVALLRAHLAGPFGTQYPEIVPVVSQRAKQGRRVIGKLPAKEVVARVTGGFTLRSQSIRSVTLVPSYYVYPFVIVVNAGRDVVLVYGARSSEDAPRHPVSAQTVRVLKALADETRLRILGLLAQRPMYGQQIAEALGLTHPTVSHHMALLRIAGLTRTELAEDGSKRYVVQPDTVEALCVQLRDAFVVPYLTDVEARS
jgi:DNA-binding transcriptional ArsR family regulator